MGRVLDRLLDLQVISPESYEDVKSQDGSVKKMRNLMNLGNIRISKKAKNHLYDILEESEPFMMKELGDQDRFAV